MSLKSDLLDWRSWAIILVALGLWAVAGGIEHRSDKEFAQAVCGQDVCRIDGK